MLFRILPCLTATLFTSIGTAEINPPDVPAGATVTLDISGKSSRPVDPMILGLNCSWPEGLYGKTGFNNPDAQKLIRQFQPVALRFPHGVWANFYDWESDGRRITDSYKTPYDSAVKDHPELKYGFEGFTSLHKEIGFDVLFTWNVNYDSPEKGALRLVDLREKGFKANHIELGNEIFWKTQRSEATSTVEKYISVAKAHAAALKKIDPAIKVSVPVHWREALTNPWNLAFENHDWFDAVTVHKYIEIEGVEKEPSARQQMLEMGKEIRQVFPGKPIWLSEWAVNAEDETTSILQTADTWLAVLENPQLFAIADFFQMNAEHPLIKYDRKTGTHTRTEFGAAYETLRIAFHDAEIINSELKISGGLDAVSAMATQKDGKICIIAINRTDQPIPFTTISPVALNPSNSHHRALSVREGLSFAMDEEFLKEFPQAGDKFSLPPQSISLIEFQAQP